MKFIRFSNLLSFFILLPIAINLVQGSDNTLSSEDDQCPTWYFYDATNKRCECYSNEYTDDIVKCIEQGVLLRLGYCMTFEEEDGFYVGPCNYFDLSKYKSSDKIYYINLPSNVSELNHYMCTPLNRKGIMCGQCIDGYGPSITSAGYHCKKCSDQYGLLLFAYLLLMLVEVVFIYFTVLLLRLHLTSAPMVAIVLYSQIQERLFLTASNIMPDRNISLLWKILMVFYGIFNLNFVRYIIPPFCASPILKPYHITFLNYIPLIYILCLIAITWICIKSHSKNVKIIVLLWNKMKLLSKHMCLKWDSKNTIVDGFVTIFLLSYAKLLFTSSWTASIPTFTYKANNSSVERQLQPYIYADPDIEYYGKEHLPAVIISYLVSLFIVQPLPILLALYPSKLFRLLIFDLPIISHHMGTINIFLHKFYSCCRDGLDGGRDMRSFVSIHYFVCWLSFFLDIVRVALSLEVNVSVVVFAGFGFLIALVQPYKTTFMNVADTLILANLALFCLLLKQCSQQKTRLSSESCYIFLSILNMIIPLAVVTAITCRVLRVLKKSSCCWNNIRDVHNDEELEQTSLDIDAHEAPNLLLNSEQHNPENNYGSTEQSLEQSYP